MFSMKNPRELYERGIHLQKNVAIGISGISGIPSLVCTFLKLRIKIEICWANRRVVRVFL